MFKKTIWIFIFAAVFSCSSAGCVQASRADANSVPCDSLKEVLSKLQETNNAMESFSCQVEYLFSQPLFESQTLRIGKIYYQRSDNGSKLRMRFDMIKQDDNPVQSDVEDYYFDGIWLTRIEHSLKKVTKRQLADINEPVDAFELLGRNFPIVGFSNIDRLNRDFKIEQVIKKEQTALHLRLKPLKDSRYFHDYTSIDFQVDRERFIPVGITAYSTEEDIYEIRLNEPKMNEEIAENIFNIDIPGGFSKPEVFPLKKAGK